MQKKIIALAIAGLASSAAFAQTNVQIYGSVDAGYSYRFDPEFKTTGQHTRSGIDSGQSAGNRLGFRGTEDLGNGLKAVFLLEQGFNFDNGAMGQGGTTFGRQAYVGLAGGFGTVIAGRLYTPHWSFLSSIDPFGGVGVGQYRNVWGANNSSGGLLNLLDPLRVDNAIAYVSPNFGGLDVTLAYSNAASPDGTAPSAATQDNAGENAKNNTVYAALVKYAGGPVVVGLNVHRIAASTDVARATTGWGLNNLDSATLGATFDLKVVKLHAASTYSNIDFQGPEADVSVSNYLLGATAPIGKATLKASVAYSDFNGRVNSGLGGYSTQYAMGADYAVSKRTAFYAAYALIDGTPNRTAIGLGTADASNGGTASSAAVAGTPAGLPGITAGNAYQQAFQIGVRHTF